MGGGGSGGSSGGEWRARNQFNGQRLPLDLKGYAGDEGSQII